MYRLHLGAQGRIGERSRAKAAATFSLSAVIVVAVPFATEWHVKFFEDVIASAYPCAASRNHAGGCAAR
jgi:hypothetical protein